MSTDIFRRYLDLLNEARGPAPTEFAPTHFHKNFLGAKIPLMQTPDGSFWWMTTDPESPRAGRTIQPWIGNTKDRSSTASVDGVIVDKKPVEFPDGTNWEENSSVSQSATPGVGSDLVPPNTSVALPSSGTFSNDDALAALAKKLSSGDKQTSGGPEDGPGLAGGARCAICGTTKMEHSGLSHTFTPGDNVRPAPVPQTGPQDVPSGGGGNVSRIKQLQKELLAAGANLGTTGANHDGIDGDIGPLTRTAMAKYPDIAAKYKDLGAGQGATPPGKSSIDKVNTALTAIEGILTKYKVKINEDQELQNPADQMKQWRSLMEAPPNLTPAQQAAQRAGLGMPRLAGVPAFGSAGAASANAAGANAAGSSALKTGSSALKGALGRVTPGLGLTLGAADAYNKAKEGDYTGAGISGLAGIASLFPGPGTWISGGLLALGLARDLAKEPTVAISAEDAKTIAENIKIIQDWQKDPANRDALTPELKTRIANVLKGVATLGVPTESATPATTPAGTPATTPAAGANSKLDQINQTLDSMDKLLKKNNFESSNNKKSPPLTEAEQMARLRSIVTEDVSDYIPSWETIGKGAALVGATKAYNKLFMPQNGAAAKPAPAAPGAATAPAAPGAATASRASNYLKSLLVKAGPMLSRAGSLLKTGGIGAMIYFGYKMATGLYDAVMEDPETAAAAGIDPKEIQQLKQLTEQLTQLVGDGKDLPPEVQEKYMAIQQRIVKLGERFALEQQAKEQNRKAREKNQ